MSDQQHDNIEIWRNATVFHKFLAYLCFRLPACGPDAALRGALDGAQAKNADNLSSQELQQQQILQWLVDQADQGSQLMTSSWIHDSYNPSFLHDSNLSNADKLRGLITNLDSLDVILKELEGQSLAIAQQAAETGTYTAGAQQVSSIQSQRAAGIGALHSGSHAWPQSLSNSQQPLLAQQTPRVDSLDDLSLGIGRTQPPPSHLVSPPPTAHATPAAAASAKRRVPRGLITMLPRRGRGSAANRGLRRFDGESYDWRNRPFGRVAQYIRCGGRNAGNVSSHLTTEPRLDRASCPSIDEGHAPQRGHVQSDARPYPTAMVPRRGRPSPTTYPGGLLQRADQRLLESSSTRGIAPSPTGFHPGPRFPTPFQGLLATGSVDTAEVLGGRSRGLTPDPAALPADPHALLNTCSEQDFFMLLGVFSMMQKGEAGDPAQWALQQPNSSSTQDTLVGGGVERVLSATRSALGAGGGNQSSLGEFTLPPARGPSQTPGTGIPQQTSQHLQSVHQQQEQVQHEQIQQEQQQLQQQQLMPTKEAVVGTDARAPPMWWVVQYVNSLYGNPEELFLTGSDNTPPGVQHRQTSARSVGQARGGLTSRSDVPPRPPSNPAPPACGLDQSSEDDFFDTLEVPSYPEAAQEVLTYPPPVPMQYQFATPPASDEDPGDKGGIPLNVRFTSQAGNAPTPVPQIPYFDSMPSSNSSGQQQQNVRYGQQAMWRQTRVGGPPRDEISAVFGPELGVPQYTQEHCEVGEAADADALWPLMETAPAEIAPENFVQERQPAPKPLHAICPRKETSRSSSGRPKEYSGGPRLPRTRGRTAGAELVDEGTSGAVTSRSSGPRGGPAQQQGGPSQARAAGDQNKTRQTALNRRATGAAFAAEAENSHVLQQGIAREVRGAEQHWAGGHGRRSQLQGQESQETRSAYLQQRPLSAVVGHANPQARHTVPQHSGSSRDSRLQPQAYWNSPRYSGGSTREPRVVTSELHNSYLQQQRRAKDAGSQSEQRQASYGPLARSNTDRSGGGGAGTSAQAYRAMVSLDTSNTSESGNPSSKPRKLDTWAGPFGSQWSAQSYGARGGGEVSQRASGSTSRMDGEAQLHDAGSSTYQWIEGSSVAAVVGNSYGGNEDFGGEEAAVGLQDLWTRSQTDMGGLEDLFSRLQQLDNMVTNLLSVRGDAAQTWRDTLCFRQDQ